MPIHHLLLLLLVVTIWGINFLFVKVGVQEIAPLLMCALRFFLASVPAIFFIRPPKIPFKIITAYGFVMFGMQFSLVFISMKVGMTAGMASLLMQVQVFFTLFFAIIFLKEQPNPSQIIGALVSFLGIALVALHFDNQVSLAGFLLVLAASASWGVGNLITKKIKSPNFFALVVWSSFITCFPMLALSLIFEGPSAISYSYDHLTWKGIGSLLYIVYISTIVGYGLWNWLVNSYPIGMVVPFTLLIPVVGLLASVLFLGEPFQLWKLSSGLLVISGLCINIISTRFSSMKIRAKEAS